MAAELYSMKMVDGESCQKVVWEKKIRYFYHLVHHLNSMGVRCSLTYYDKETPTIRKRRFHIACESLCE